MNGAPGAPSGRSEAFPKWAVAACLCAALATWLAIPRRPAARVADAPPLRVVLVDASASVTRVRSTWARWVRQRLAGECSAAEASAARIAVVRFAEEVRVDFEPGSPAELRAWLLGRGRPPYSPALEGQAGDRGSALDAALQAAEGWLREGGRPERDLLVLSDGTFTGRDPGPRLAALRAAGVRVTHGSLPGADRADLALEDLRVGDRLEAGVSLVAEVALSLAPGGSEAPGPDGAAGSATTADLRGLTPVVRLEYRSDGGESLSIERPSRPDGRTLRSRDPRDPLDPLEWRDRLELPPPPIGGGVLTARVRLEAGGRPVADPIPENDLRTREVRVGEALTCLVLTPPGRSDALLAGLRGPAFDGLRMRPTTLADLAFDLADADVLVTESVGPGELPRGALRTFVRGGGGWLSMGGLGAFRGWGATEPDTLADELPFELQEADPSERDVVLLIDGSGSMAGEPFEIVRRAAVDLVLGARARDRVSLRFFTGALGDAVFEAQGARWDELKRALEPLFRARVPRGPTDVLYTLDQLAEWRESSSRRGLVLLVTDGRTLLWHQERSAEVRARLAASRTDLRIVAVGDAADREFLASLLLAGEALEEARDLERLARVFQEEVQGERLRQAPEQRGLTVGLAGLDPGGVAEDVLHAQLEVLAAGEDRGAEPEAFPNGARDLGPVSRAIALRERPGAEVLWRTGTGEVLLGLWRRGAGLVASLGTTPLDGWAPALARRPELLAPLLRALARGRGDRANGGPRRPRLSVDGEELLLEFVPVDAPLTLSADFFRPLRTGSALEALDARDPERAFGVREQALGRVELSLPPRGRGADPRTLRSAPRPAFLDRFGPGERLSVELSASGGSLGRVALSPGTLGEFLPAESRTVAMMGAESPGSEIPGAPAASPEGASSSSASQGDPEAHPATPWVLALGLALGAFAASRFR